MPKFPRRSSGSLLSPDASLSRSPEVVLDLSSTSSDAKGADMSGESERAYEGLQSLTDRDSHRPASVGSRSSRSGSLPALINLSGQAGARERSPRGTGRGSDALSGEESFRPIRGRVSSRVSSPLPIADRHGFDENERRTQRRLTDDRASTESPGSPLRA